jgi:hypothetical protein
MFPRDAGDMVKRHGRPRPLLGVRAIVGCGGSSCWESWSSTAVQIGIRGHHPVTNIGHLHRQLRSILKDKTVEMSSVPPKTRDFQVSSHFDLACAA